MGSLCRNVVQVMLLCFFVAGCGFVASSSLPDWYDARYPLMENKGLYPEEVAYFSRYPDRISFLTKGGMTFSKNYFADDVQFVVKLALPHADNKLILLDEEQSESSFFIGENQQKGIKGYPRVRYSQLSSGVDVDVVPGSQDFGFVFSSSSYKNLENMDFELEGCEELFIEESGNLMCKNDVYERIFLSPKSDLGVSYSVENAKVSFVFDQDETLVDPVSVTMMTN